MTCTNLVGSFLSFGARLTDALLGFDRSGTAASDVELPPEIEALLDEFNATNEGLPMLEAGRQGLVELGKIPALLKWNQGLRQAIYDLILQTVVEAERYGEGNGELKRRFAIDLVGRVLRDYQPTPLFELVEDVTVKPYLGVLVDWTVEVLNVHNAWPPVTEVKIPSFYSGKYGALLRLQSWVWRIITTVRDAVVYPSNYERNLRDSLRKVAPQVQSLKAVLPPSAQRRNLEEIASTIARAGHLTAPHVRVASLLLKAAARIADQTPEQRRELAYAVMRLLLKRAYANNWLAVSVLDSSIGDFMIAEMVRSTEWVLARNGLLPTVNGALAAR